MELADPLTLARRALAAASPTTSVGMGTAVRVAGRAAYVLVLTPKDATTLVGRVEVAVDATTHVPLATAVFAKGAAFAGHLGPVHVGELPAHPGGCVSLHCAGRARK